MNGINRGRMVVGVVSLAGFAALAMVSIACGSRAAASPTTPPPPEVGVVTVEPSVVPIYREYPARTYARDQVEVRGRVDGYIERRTFDIGSDVRQGQVLYVLDARPYQAEADRARGALAQASAEVVQAEANLRKAEQDLERLEPLVKEEAAPRQDLDNARTALQAARATVESKRAAIEAARAQLKTAELNVEYATIRAPISGRIGDSLLQVGGLVSRTSPEPLTTIVPLDAIWVRFQLSEPELAAFQRIDARKLPIELTLNDGRTHRAEGQIENTLNGVNTRTGTLEVQARFANPDHTLLPGQFGRVRIRLSEKRDGLLVPQVAVQELQGTQTVLVVGADNTVQPRTIVATNRVGDSWLVDQGLAPGDTVIVDGVQKAMPGSTVRPTAVQAAAATAEN